MCCPRHAHALRPFTLRDWLRPIEFDALVSASPLHIAFQLHLLVGTGMKPTELFALRWDAIDFEHNLIGTSHEVIVVMRPHVRSIVKLMPRGASDHVVLTPCGKPYASKTRSGGQNKSGLYRVRARAGLPDFTLGYLESTFAVWHLALHSDRARLKIESGWSTYRLRRHDNVRAEELDIVREQLLRLRDKKSGILSAGLFALEE